MNDFNENEMLTTKQVAEMLKIKPSTIFAWKCLGKMKIPYYSFGKSLRFKRKDVIEYINKNYSPCEAFDE